MDKEHLKTKTKVKPTTNILLNGKIIHFFLLQLGKIYISFSITSIHYYLVVPNNYPKTKIIMIVVMIIITN